MRQPHMKRRVAHAEVGQTGHAHEVLNAEVVGFAAVDPLQDGQGIRLG